MSGSSVPQERVAEGAWKLVFSIVLHNEKRKKETDRTQRRLSAKCLLEKHETRITSAPIQLTLSIFHENTKANTLDVKRPLSYRSKEAVSRSSTVTDNWLTHNTVFYFFLFYTPQVFLQKPAGLLGRHF